MKPVALIGFMGAGKTSVGRELAGRLAFEFIDLDRLIEHKENISISEMFKTYGESYFRDKETYVLKEALMRENIVLSCGGGIILKDENKIALKEKAIVIYLQADAGELYKRVGHTGNKRPLLDVADPLNEIKIIRDKRMPLYENVSDIIVDTKSMSIKSIVEYIIDTLENAELINSSR
jgi:shikimate kinase